MAIKSYKPTSPGRRFGTVGSFADITKTEPEKRLTSPVRRSGGRNNSGKLTMRHVGGGAKRLYRTIDFKRDKIGVPGKVVAIGGDPNPSVRIRPGPNADGVKGSILG